MPSERGPSTQEMQIAMRIAAAPDPDPDWWLRTACSPTNTVVETNATTLTERRKLWALFFDNTCSRCPVTRECLVTIMNDRYRPEDVGAAGFPPGVIGRIWDGVQYFKYGRVPNPRIKERKDD